MKHGSRKFREIVLYPPGGYRQQKYANPVMYREWSEHERSVFESRLLRQCKPGTTDECWPLQGYSVNKGYGTMTVDTLVFAPYRVAYKLWAGPLDPNLCIDHLCRNTICVNPWHMEQVTKGLNTLRGFGSPAQNARKTHCIHGHELPPYVKGGSRVCRICATESARRWAEANPEKAKTAKMKSQQRIRESRKALNAK